MRKNKNLNNGEDTIDVLETVGLILTVGQVIVTVLNFLRRFKKQ
ncbi:MULTISPECIES: hypothetical protein [Lactobacillus]|nr:MULTISPECIES: hypothetical protein [Lactobacillus]